MRYRDALKLHNGDEVIDKISKESIKVICSFEEPIVPGKTAVMIEGIGEKQGYNHWQHTMVE